MSLIPEQCILQLFITFCLERFIVYKLPHNTSSSNPLIRDGVAHMYLDVNSQSFVFSQVSLNDTNQAVAYTLQQIYDNHQSQVQKIFLN